MKFGYKLYFAPEEHKSDLEKIRRNTQSREDLIQNLDEACKDVNFGLINYSNTPYLQERAQKHYEILLKQKELHHKIKEAENMRKIEEMKIPTDFDYIHMDGLALEARQKLDKIRPLTIGQASRISGVNPSDVSVLILNVRRYFEHE